MARCILGAFRVLAGYLRAAAERVKWRSKNPHPEVPARSAGLEGCRHQSNRMGAFADMLQCADGSYYVGSARGDDLEKRVAEHEAGAYGGYTSSRRPVRLVWSERFDRITDAITAERQIKGWSRAKKKALIEGHWGEIGLLASRRAGKPTSVSEDKAQLKRRSMASWNASASAFEARPLRSRAPQDEEK